MIIVKQWLYSLKGLIYKAMTKPLMGEIRKIKKEPKVSP